MQMNLKTTISAYPQLSDTILKSYVKKDQLEQAVQETMDPALEEVKAYVADNYVPEVSDKDSDKVYARSGKDRQWVELRDTAEAKDIDIYFGHNDDEQMDVYRDLETGLLKNDIVNLQGSESISKNSKYYDLDYTIPEGEEGYLWICSTQPVKAIQWMGFSWGEYTKQTDAVVDPDTGKTYYCYHSNDILTDNQWQFRLIF